MSGTMGRFVDFEAAPTRGQRYNSLPYDPTPPDTKITNLYTVEHQSLNVNSSDCWRERVKMELNNKKVLNDSKLRAKQKKSDSRRMASEMLPKREKTLPPAYRDKPLEPYRENSRRSVPPREFRGEKNFKKFPNYRNKSQFTFHGMDGHSFVDNTRLRYSTLTGLSHDAEAITKFVTDNPCITSDLVKHIHVKTYK